jgi:hypothetical protein
VSRFFHRIIVTDVIVYAKTPKEADEIAQNSLPEIKSNETFDVDNGGEITSLAAIPYNWEASSIPYGDCDSRTIKELFEAGGGPPEGNPDQIELDLEVGK